MIESRSNRHEEIAKIKQFIPKKVRRDQNLAPLRMITEKEVDEVIKTMAKNKAPSLDEFTVEFFQATWRFMKKDIVNAVEESRSHKRMHLAWNATFLTLIPKLDQAEEPHNFRPIALCNVIYKIMATIMVKGLQPLLPKLIAKEQTRFVKGR